MQNIKPDTLKAALGQLLAPTTLDISDIKHAEAMLDAATLQRYITALVAEEMLDYLSLSTASAEVQTIERERMLAISSFANRLLYNRKAPYGANFS